MTATVDEATTAPGEVEEIKGRSLTQIAWGRLRRDKTFIASAIVLIIILYILTKSVESKRARRERCPVWYHAPHRPS